MADALLVRLPSGREIPLHDAPLPLGRSTSPPLCDHEAVSRTHVRLEPLEGGGDVMLLRLVSRNAVAVEVQAEGAGGEVEWRISELLEQPGDACPVAAGSRFFVVSLHEETLCTLLAAAPAASTLALPPLDAQQQQQPERLATPQEQHLAKRQRLEQPVNGAGTAPSIPAAPAGAAGRSDPGPPVHLLETEGIPQGFNVPPMGATLGDLAGGAPSLALVTSYKVDFPWLLSVCPGLRTAGQVILLSPASEAQQQDFAALVADKKLAGSFLHHMPSMAYYQLHHSKLLLLVYEDGLRLVVTTANLVYADVCLKTDAVWHQDFPRKPPTSPPAPASAFETYLSSYLAALKLPQPHAAQLLAAVAAHDFSSARGHLVASVPGVHKGADLCAYGHMRLRRLLSREAMAPEFKRAAVAMQCTSLGGLAGNWLVTELIDSFAAGSYGASGGANGAVGSKASSNGSKASGSGSGGQRQGGSAAVGGATAGITLHFVWPTVEEVCHSLEGWDAGGSIPARVPNMEQLVRFTSRQQQQLLLPKLQAPQQKGQQQQQQQKQRGKQQPQGQQGQGCEVVLCKWGGQPVGRQRAMPHIKSYCRFLGDRLPWYLISSHNVSKGAWGQLQLNGTQLKVNQYELGVLITPTTEAAYRAHPHCGFACNTGGSSSGSGGGAGVASSSGGGAYLQPPAAAALASAGGISGQQPAVTFQAWSKAVAATAPDSSATATLLPVPYPLPPEPYSALDTPWTWDVAHHGPDVYGGYWAPVQ